MDEGKLWSLIRNVLSQGGAIQLDRASMSGYEEYSARLDAAAAERVADFAKLADARIAEIERECSQWRDELRIYRETESKRIAELEQDVTELQRIKQAAELVLRWDWSDNDDDCLDDMRELSKAIDKARAGNGGGV